ncbi:MAG: hypothetical protein ACREJN_20010, partial [Nitrospiraceae bacterium]
TQRLDAHRLVQKLSQVVQKGKQPEQTQEPAVGDDHRHAVGQGLLGAGKKSPQRRLYFVQRPLGVQRRISERQDHQQ